MKNIFIFLLFILANSVVYSQNTSMLSEFEKKYEKLPAKQKIDSTLAIPYDIFVSDLFRAKKMFSLSLQQSIKIKDKIRITECKQKIGLVNYYLGEYDSASYYTLSALDEYTKLKEYKKAANLYCDYGHMIKRRDLKKAFELMRKGLTILKKEGKEMDLSTCMNNFGVLHEMNNDIDSALFYYESSLRINRKLKDSIGIPYNMVKIGTALLYKNKFEAAKSYFDTAHFIRVKRNDLLGITDDHAYYGDLYKAWGKFDLAINYFKECIELSKSSGYPFLIQYSYEELAKCYEKTDNYLEALNSYREAQKIKDSLLSEKNTKTVLELEERFKSVEKERIILKQNKDIIARNLEIETKAKENILLFGILIISIFIGIFITLFILQKEKQKRQKLIIHEREKGIIAVIESTETERRRIARDLHDGIGQQLGGLKLAWQQLGKNANEEEKKKLESLTEILNETSTEVRNLSHQMMPKMLEQDGLRPALEDMLQKTLGIAGIKYEFNFSSKQKRLDAAVELSIYRISQELIGNILKHSGANQVTLDFYERQQKYFLMVEDNGKGFQETSSSGLGLQNIRARATAIKGEISFESSPGKGTVVILTVPQ